MCVVLAVPGATIHATGRHDERTGDGRAALLSHSGIDLGDYVIRLSHDLQTRAIRIFTGKADVTPTAAFSRHNRHDIPRIEIDLSVGCRTVFD